MPPGDVAPVLIVALLIVAAAAVLILRGPLGRALARRLEGTAGQGEATTGITGIAERVSELEQRDARLAELEERLDFAAASFSPSVMPSACLAGGTTTSPTLQTPMPTPPAPEAVIVSAGGGGPSAFEALSICVIAISFGFVAYKLLLPLVRAFAARIEGRGGNAALEQRVNELQQQLADADALQQRVARTGRAP